MKPVILLISLIATHSSCSKSAKPDAVKDLKRYEDKVFSSVSKATIAFDIQPDYSGNATTLYADVYSPLEDTASSRAAIVFVHGGGFTSGTRDGSNIPYLCNELAKKGYVVASIDYRVGVPDTTAAQKGKAQVRALQDLKSFIRYAKQNAQMAKIDTGRIFIAGSSAGGATVLAAAYLNYGEQPAYVNPVTAADLQGYGNINGYSANVRAVYSMWVPLVIHHG
jgi:acetyl esterase/lipase